MSFEPKSIARTMIPIIEAIGFDAALSLVRHFGGAYVNVPAQPRPYDEICKAMTVQQALALLDAVGAGRLDIPKCQSWLLARRNEEIVNRHLYGESQRDLALRFNLTTRTIRTILADDRESALQPSPQEDLFTERTP